MSLISYTAFPKRLETFRLSEIKGREREFGINYSTSHWRRDDIFLFPDISPEESHILVVDVKGATFDNCFINGFVYELVVIGLSDDSRGQREAIVKCYSDERKKSGCWDKEKMNRELSRLWEAEWAKQQRVLHDFFNKNLADGEFVEKYIAWDNHENTAFCPPTKEEVMTLQEFLNMPMSAGTTPPDERFKLTIYKT